MVIEVNGKSHNRLDRTERDVLVNEIFKDAQLPLETINVGSNFNESILKIKANLHV